MLLSIVGIQISGIITALSAMILAVGMALQNNIANLANGVIIVATKMFKKGDTFKCHDEKEIISLMGELKKDGYDFELNMVGIGPLEEEIKNSIKEKGLEDYVKLLGSTTPEGVREEMDKADIFLFNSDFHEGWGAVMNESMNSACAVVASHAIGSVPFLIDNGKNGFVYENGNIEDLYKKVKHLCDNPEKRIEMGKAAYETITKQWCAENATQRLYSIIKAKVEKTEEPIYTSGPCSKAEVITPKYRKDSYDKI